MEAWRLQVEKDTLSLGVQLPIQEFPSAAIEIWGRILLTHLGEITHCKRLSLAYIADISNFSSDSYEAAMQVLHRALIKVLTRRHFS
jgi:hypothetical protein